MHLNTRIIELAKLNLAIKVFNRNSKFSRVVDLIVVELSANNM